MADNFEGIYEESLQPVWQKSIRDSYARIKGATNIKIDEASVTELLTGAFDTHIHAGPDSYGKRQYTEGEVAVKACQYHMGGVVFKCQSSASSAREIFVKQIADRYAEENGLEKIQIFSGVVLSLAVGGINPHAAEASLAMGGKYVWTPTRDASHHKRAEGRKDKGIEVCGKGGGLIPEMYEIFDMIAAKDGILGISHQSTRERFLMVREARKRGVQRIVIEHPQMHISRLTIDQMKEIRSMGAHLGICYASAVPSFLGSPLERGEVAEIIHTLGTDMLVSQTDLTQLQTVDPVEGLRLFAKTLLSLGVTEQEIKRIFVDNCRELLL